MADSEIRLPPWSVFMAECADGMFYAGMARDINKTLLVANHLKQDGHLKEKNLPIKISFKEEGLSFREAWAKKQYMRQMNRKLRTKLVTTGRWPMGGQYRRWLEKFDEKGVEDIEST